MGVIRIKAKFIRVGVDKGRFGDGFFAPLFRNGRFEYIPISEDYPSSQRKKYADFNFKEFCPKELWKKKPHFDPEFITYTYGDSSDAKGLKGLDTDDVKKGFYLIFWENFFPYEGEYSNNNLSSIQKIQARYKKVVCVIGYFKVKDIVKCWEEDNVKRRYPNNAHLFRRSFDKDTIIVVGNGEKKHSRLLRKAYPIAWEYKRKRGGYVGSRDLKEFGLNNKPFMQSYISYTIHGRDKVKRFLNIINKGPDKELMKTIFALKGFK